MLATALFDKPSFNTCVSHGIVLGDDGQKMSKSLQNYPDPMMVFDTYGSDAMRWYLLSSPILRGTDLMVTEEGIRDTVRQIILPIWHNITKQQVIDFSPSLADKVARSTATHTPQEIAAEIAELLRSRAQ